MASRASDFAKYAASSPLRQQGARPLRLAQQGRQAEKGHLDLPAPKGLEADAQPLPTRPTRTLMTGHSSVAIGTRPRQRRRDGKRKRRNHAFRGLLHGDAPRISVGRLGTVGGQPKWIVTSRPNAYVVLGNTRLCLSPRALSAIGCFVPTFPRSEQVMTNQSRPEPDFLSAFKRFIDSMTLLLGPYPSSANLSAVVPGPYTMSRRASCTRRSHPFTK